MATQYIDKEKGFTVIAPCKCASSSLRESLADVGLAADHINNWQIQDSPNIFLFYRDPYKWYKSGYDFTFTKDFNRASEDMLTELRYDMHLRLVANWTKQFILHRSKDRANRNTGIFHEQWVNHCVMSPNFIYHYWLRNSHRQKLTLVDIDNYKKHKKVLKMIHQDIEMKWENVNKHKQVLEGNHSSGVELIIKMLKLPAHVLRSTK